MSDTPHSFPLSGAGFRLRARTIGTHTLVVSTAGSHAFEIVIP